MVKLYFVFFVYLIVVNFADAAPLPLSGKIAVSLSYDDALASQLDNALPALNKYGFKASFYLVPTAKAFQTRLNEWRAAAAQGHELGNHTLYHACRGSLPNRHWVAEYADLDTRSVAAMEQEIRLANTVLYAVDGKNQRTLTLPCGENWAAGKPFLPAVESLFVAVKGQGVASGDEVLWAPTDVNGEELIKFIEQVDPQVKVISVLFHGVGGDHLSVSKQAHQQLLAYLAAHPERYIVDSYVSIMQQLQAKAVTQSK